MMFFVNKIHNINVDVHESLKNCLKLKQQVPTLNLNCDDLISLNYARSSGKAITTGTNFVELTKNDNTNTQILKKDDEEELDVEYERIEKLEKMMESLSGNVRTMDEELKMLKNSINKKRNIKGNVSKESNVNRVNAKQNTNNDINNSSNVYKNNEKKKSVLKMKTFNDLELNLNLINTNTKIKKDNNKDLNDMDFLKNIIQETKPKKNEKIIARNDMKFDFKEIPQVEKNIKSSEDEAEKIYELINKLKEATK